MANTQSKFIPYEPPVIIRLNASGGAMRTTPASSLLSRLHTERVDDEVISVVAWALSFFTAKAKVANLRDPASAGKLKDGGTLLTARLEQELLDELGLEWEEDPMGAVHLVPKAEFRIERTDPKQWAAPPASACKPGESVYGVWRRGHKGAFMGTVNATSAEDAVTQYAAWAEMDAGELVAHRGRG